MDIQFPARYEQVAVLGKGGGGQVWAVRDRLTHHTLAFKALAEGADNRQVEALVREAVTLSGLEGLGVPRALRFGRLPATGQPYMVRELVEGSSLLSLIESRADPNVCLDALAQAASQLTSLHRAGLLHGDVKPANIIVAASGKATLVDLGLAAPWREGGTRPEGLTPRYAAPELFAGLSLTVRAEIYALGATLDDVLQHCEAGLDSSVAKALHRILQRATHHDPAHRYPSADELASAVRHAAQIPVSPAPPAVDASWPILALDSSSSTLLSRVASLPLGSVLTLEGRRGSGRTVLLRRLAWTLGIEGKDVAWVDANGASVLDEIDMELSGCSSIRGTTILVDSAESIGAPLVQRLSQALRQGARVVLSSGKKAGESLGASVQQFTIPSLPTDAAQELVRRAIPSLSDHLVAHVIQLAEGRPGKLRAILRRIGPHPVVSTSDVDELLREGPSSRRSFPPEGRLKEVEHLLDQGKYEEAGRQLDTIVEADPLMLALCRTRLALGRGEAHDALRLLVDVQPMILERSELIGRTWNLHASRAHLRLGHYTEAAEHARKAAAAPTVDVDDDASRSVILEGQASLGLAQSYLGQHDEAQKLLAAASEQARKMSDRRVAAVVLASSAFTLQRAGKRAEAREAYQQALEAAEGAGDAGAVALTRLNLAVLAHEEGDLAAASEHLEAAIDMGKRAGRGSTTRQALLNLANLDIYLGRYVRARSSLAALTEQREELAATHRAQLLGLEAELAARTGEPARAMEQYEACANAYETLGRQVDAAEARLEAVLLAARAGLRESAQLSSTLEAAANALGESTAHRALLHLCTGAVAAGRNDEPQARRAYDAALEAARGAGQKEWAWRTLEMRSALFSEMGQELAARRDNEEALALLEEVASRLPRDLREVYWDDPRRRRVRLTHLGTLASARAHSVAIDSPRWQAVASGMPPRPHGSGMSSTVASPPLEERLAKLLEINRELAREYNLERLLERVTDHAITLLNAERGFVILRRNGDLVVHTSRSRSGDDEHAKFSRGIAERVVASGEPVVTMSARDDERMAGYVSVHQLNVQSVACVPIRAPDGRTAGALYVETRLRPGNLFHAELATLSAFADQAAIAIEYAHLLSENKQRADELAATNEELVKAQNRLKELLGHRTAQLHSTRRDLESTRAVLQGHFGYQGLVGTSEKMRRVYALVDRVKDMDVPVLITGESGTGKEMVARAIHKSSPRGKKPFTGVNCGAIPEHLLESELFGHVRGAFTGADRDRKGLFRETEGGTILLDEIGEMPHKMQAGLLRVLQDHLVRPVGGVREEPVSVRVIAATNRDLERMVRESAFREDLYYRLHVVEVKLPPLRERVDDIPTLIDHFLQIFAARYRRERKTISRDALRFLSSCPWPGNVRQLENTLLNAWVMSDQTQLELQDFAVDGLRVEQEPTASGVQRRPEPGKGSIDPNLSAHQASEKDRILGALTECSWNRVKAAEIVGIPRRTFYRRLRKYGIQ